MSEEDVLKQTLKHAGKTGGEIKGAAQDIASSAKELTHRALLQHVTQSGLAEHVATMSGIVGPLILLGVSFVALVRNLRKRTESSHNRAAKLGLIATQGALYVGAIAAIAAAPVALLPIMAAAAGVMLVQKVRSFFRAWQARRDIKKLILQKQAKLTAANKSNLTEKSVALENEIDQLKAYQQPEEEKKRADLEKQILLLEVEIAGIKKLKSNRLEEIKKNSEVLLSHEKKLTQLKADYQACPGVMLLSNQTAKRNLRAVQAGVQAGAFTGLVMLAIPFPPIQIVGAVCIAAAAITGLAYIVATNRKALAASFDRLGEKIAKEVMTGFPTVKNFFSRMVNAVAKKVGIAPPFKEVMQEKKEALETIPTELPEQEKVVPEEDSTEEALREFNSHPVEHASVSSNSDDLVDDKMQVVIEQKIQSEQNSHQETAVSTSKSIEKDASSEDEPRMEP